MNWTRLSILTLMLVLIFTVAAFASHFGFTVHGIPFGGLSADSPGVWGLLEWGWNAVVFMQMMSTFQIDDMPYLFSILFVIMELVCIFIIVTVFLPGGAG